MSGCNTVRVQGAFDHLLAHSSSAVLAGLRGQAFEAHMHRHFKTMLQQPIYRLPIDGGVPGPEQRLADLGLAELPQTQNRFDDLGTLKDGEYGIPRSRGYAAVDAILRPRFAFQATVSNEHDYNVDGLEAVKDGLGLESGDPLHLILVCPPDIKPHVRCQHLVRGKQRVKQPVKLKDGTGLFQYVMAMTWN